jgi:hypothetical protein
MLVVLLSDGATGHDKQFRDSKIGRRSLSSEKGRLSPKITLVTTPFCVPAGVLFLWSGAHNERITNGLVTCLQTMQACKHPRIIPIGLDPGSLEQAGIRTMVIFSLYSIAAVEAPKRIQLSPGQFHHSLEDPPLIYRSRAALAPLAHLSRPADALSDGDRAGSLCPHALTPAGGTPS